MTDKSNDTRWFADRTQRFYVCSALLSGEVLSHRTTIRHVDCWRLAAIIEVLANQYDWPIEREYRGKDKIRYYWLKPGTRLCDLNFPPSAKSLKEDAK
ncbi:hypothetical protein [Halocynthiibacter styelae]|uniref:Uncharacterized protein n=1 Tax=Halocynthiibacter styelae TaxID=2761955 RepID=A0A8J7IYU3_9RHOB|nr:hypothetical protein [Paenihalocynthiibacter styelae]MBI1494800.1 hypothetical protein [Paenihalocynthiibacter styelae]